MRPAPDSGAARTTWRASDAWICAVVLIVLSYCFNEVLWNISRSGTAFASWLASPVATLALRIFRAAWWVLVVFLFARPRFISEFLNRAGLTAPPSLFGWLAAWIGV